MRPETLPCAALITLGLVVCLGACTTLQTASSVAVNGADDAPPYVQEVLADRPLAHWRLNANVPGAIAGDSDNATALVQGQALALEGADLGGPEFAVEMWLKNATGEALTYAGRSWFDGTYLSIAVTEDQRLKVEVLGQLLEDLPALAPDTWHLVGVSWRASDALVMVTLDGRLVAQRTAPWLLGSNPSQYLRDPKEPLPSGGLLKIGGDFAGHIDEVAVFDRLVYPGQWLDRVRVAHQKAPVAPPNETLPIRVVLQTGHGPILESVVWSPDGRQIASGGSDTIVKVWDVDTGAILHNFSDHTDQVSAVAWSPDGRRLASASNDGLINVRDSDSGVVLQALKAREVSSIVTLSWSPDGDKLAASGFRHIDIWDANQGTVLHSTTERDVFFRQVAWNPDGQRIATRTQEGAVQIWNWDGATLSPRHTITADNDRVESIAWSPDGAWLAIAVDGSGIEIWAEDERVHNIPVRHEAGTDFDSVAWSPDGRFIAAGVDGWIRVFHNQAGPSALDFRYYRELISHRERTETQDKSRYHISLVAWSPDSLQLVSVDERQHIDVWHTSFNGIQTLTCPHIRSADVAWSPGGHQIASADSEGFVNIWHATQGFLMRRIKAHPDHRATSLAWSPDGNRLASTGGDAVARVWDARSGALLLDLKGHTGLVDTIAWSTDGTRIASGGEHGEVKVWDASSGALLLDLKGHTDTLRSVAWSPDGNRLATGGRDSRLKIWDIPTGTLHRDFASTQHTPLLGEGREAKIEDVQWSPDGQRIAVATFFNGIDIRDASSGDVLQRLGTHTGPAHTVSWSPDGLRLAAAGSAGNVQIVDIPGNTSLHSLAGHTNDVTALSWSPDGQRLVSASWDGTLRIWSPAQDRYVVLVDRGEGSWLAVTDDGYFGSTANISPRNKDTLRNSVLRPRNRKCAASIALAQGPRLFSIEQIAPARNRPDKVLTALGATPEQVAFYRALWLRRLKRLGLSPEGVSKAFVAAPTARILSHTPSEDGWQIALQVLFEDRAALAGYQVYVDGVPQYPDPVPLKGHRQRLTIPVDLAEGNNHIEVTALNTAGTESLRDTLVLASPRLHRPRTRLFYLGFGVSDYRDDRLDLGYAHQDALDLEAALSANRRHFSEVLTKTFIDAQVTGESLEQAREFLAQITAHDTLVMFVAGHGARDTDALRTYYYLDHDASFTDLKGTAIAFDDIEDLLYDTPARKKLFLIDTCQSGEDIDLQMLTKEAEGLQGLKARSIRGFLIKTPLTLQPEAKPQDKIANRLWLEALRKRDRYILQDLTRKSGATVLASSLGQEASLETASWGNGAFTEELLVALQTSVADTNKDGLIDIEELAAYITSAVPTLTQARQHPNVERTNPQQQFVLPIERY